MSALAKSSREAMKAKAHRMAAGDPHAKVDASSWSPPEMLNTEAKVGLRPVSRRAYKAGGKVDGDCGPKHAGRKPRARGGNVRSYAQDDSKEENAEKFGKPHVGGYKNGGHVDEKADRKLVDKMVKPECRTGKKDGGGKWMEKAFSNAHGQLHKATHTPMDKKIPEKKLEKADHSKSALTRKRANLAEIARRSKHADGGKCDGEYQGTRPTGGRCARKDGGRTGKGKTNINIIISAGQKPQSPMDMQKPPMPAAAPPPMIPPPPPAGAMPPAGPPAMPPMARKDGGRAAPRTTGYMNMEAGAGSALGRLQKARGKKP